MQARLIGAAAALSLFAAGAASAATLHFAATLRGASEVPATNSSGTGDVAATLNTRTRAFTYKVTYSGLSGPAVAAHFHGPAAPGVNAPPVVAVPKDALASPIVGKASLTATQAHDLETGKWYFNVHTAAHPGGEVRGQVHEVK
ncbi:MAG: CHRD domain-containing protein [Caulobacteraceae bacterium]